jgi:hypothetical protein
MNMPNKAATDAFGHVRDFAGQFDDLVHEYGVDGLQRVLNLVQRCPQLRLHAVGVRLDRVEFLDHPLDEIHFGALETRREQLVEFAHALARLLGGIDVAVDEVDELRGNRFGNPHPPTQHDSGNVPCAVGDLVLHQQQFEQIFARNRHKEALRQIQPDLLLQFVCFLFERLDFSANRGGGLPVAVDGRGEKGPEFLGTSMRNLDVLLEGHYW